MDLRSTLLVALVAMLGVQPLAANDQINGQCTGIRVESQGLSGDETSLICRARNEVLAFFQSHGIEQRSPMLVKIIDAREIDARHPHIGSYSAEQKAVKLLSQKDTLGLGNNFTLFGLPMDKSLYRTVVVHELAHAIADQNFGYADPSVVVQEYIAYVAQLGIMESEVKEEILTRAERTGFKDFDEMSCVYYAMDPGGFGIKAYLHFLTLPNPSEFLQQLLSGTIQPSEIGTE